MTAAISLRCHLSYCLRSFSTAPQTTITLPNQSSRPEPASQNSFREYCQKRNTSLNIPLLLERSKTQTSEADATKSQQRNPPPLRRHYDRNLRNETSSWVIRTPQTNLNPQTFEKSSRSADISFLAAFC